MSYECMVYMSSLIIESFLAFHLSPSWANLPQNEAIQAEDF